MMIFFSFEPSDRYNSIVSLMEKGIYSNKP